MEEFEVQLLNKYKQKNSLKYFPKRWTSLSTVHFLWLDQKFISTFCILFKKPQQK